MSKLNKIQKFLIYLLPTTLFFSYYPTISLGSTDSMNLEFSIPLLWLVVFSLISIPSLPNLFKHFGGKKLFLASTLPLYITISCIWSENQLRGLLTSGIFWLVVYSALNILMLKKQLSRPKVYASIFIPAVAASVFCWLQSILDVLGVSRDYTLLCLGCTHSAFGFPHPNGFAIEPQFMGNLLLAPTLLCYYLILIKAPKQKFTKLLALAIFLTTTLFFTFSRGAIYAFVLALAAMLLFPIKKHFTKKSNKELKTAGKIAVICVGSFIISLLAQGVFATLSSTSDTFLSGVAKSIHQLTLGIVDLRPPEKPTDSETTIESTFSGYVEESTNERLNLTNLAIKTWSKTPRIMLFGSGIGSAGATIYHYFPDEIGHSKEIVQNEYANILLELGLVGILIILCIIWVVLKSLKSYPVFLFVLLFAYGLTLLFFSGLPNALHIYLIPILLYSKHQLLVN